LPSKNLLVKTDILRKDERGAKARLRSLAGGVAHDLKAVAVAEQGERADGHLIDAADGIQKACDVIVNEFRNAADACGDGWDLAGHSLERGQAEGLQLAGHEHEVGEGKKLAYAVLLAEEVDAILNLEIVDEPFGAGAVRAVADEGEACGDFAGDACKDLDGIEDALDWPEIGEMNQQRFAGAREALAGFGADRFVTDGLVDVAVDEVGDDGDGARDIEIGEGFVAQVIGDAGDAVAFLDGVARDGQIAAVEPDERDVGSVQRGDERETAAAGGEHLAGEQGTDGVRDCVVDVEEIEIIELGDFRHSRGEGEIVGGEFEERVIGDGNLVIEDAVVAAGEAKGLRVGDEMDFVALGGELDSELSGDDAGAAVGGIAGDADAHGASGLRARVIG
jgi:hypothetical protein